MSGPNPPSHKQIARFWNLIVEGRLGRARFGRFLDEIEFGVAVAGDDSQAEQARRALRLQLAALGEKYIDMLFEHGPAGLLVRTANVVHTQQVWGGRNGTIKHLVAMTRQEVLRWRNFGPKCLQFLSERLASFGLRLGMSPQEIEDAFRPDPLHAPPHDAPPQTVEAS